jgi:hypothetical protein
MRRARDRDDAAIDCLKCGGACASRENLGGRTRPHNAGSRATPPRAARRTPCPPSGTSIASTAGMNCFLTSSLLLGSLVVASVAYAAPPITPLPPPPSEPPTVTWELDKPYVLAGTGCQKNIDAFATSNGEDLSIVFTNLQLNHPYPYSNPLADRKTCLVRIPAAIQKGLYPSRITGTFTYGLELTPNMTSTLAVASTFFGFSMSPWAIREPSPSDPPDNPLAIQSHVQDFAPDTPWQEGWCGPTRSLEGLYQASMVSTAQWPQPPQDWIDWGEGLDLKYEVFVDLAPCP